MIRLFQNFQVIGYSGLGHVKVSGDITGRKPAVFQQFQYLPSYRVR